jgi:hypothetical protein
MAFQIKLIFLFIGNLFFNIGNRFITIQNKIKLLLNISVQFKRNVVGLFKEIKKNIVFGSIRKKILSFWKTKKKE